MKTIILRGEESNYRIDEFGNVYGKRGKLKPLVWSTNCNHKSVIDPKRTRYMYSFNHKGKKIRISRARVVALYCLPEECVPPDPENWQVNHKDGNFMNDDPSNLEWVSGKGNILHAYTTGICSGKPYRKILAYKDGELVGEFPSLYKCAKELGLNAGNVHVALKKNAEGKHYTLKGYYLVEVS